MRYPITHYKTLIFDCDGVVLNSNKVKTNAFYQSTRSYGEAAAQAMVDYHIANGGVSRYKKFAYFLENIAAQDINQQEPSLEQLLHAYSGHVREGLLTCEAASSLEKLRKQAPSSRWLIVSGGDQNEIRDIFTQRSMTHWFDGGIFGSPDSKEEILEREFGCANINQPALFLGDSKYDYQVANEAGMDFVFLSGWSEVSDWQSWVTAKRINYISKVEDLVSAHSSRP